MPVREQATSQKVQLAMQAAISSDTTTVGGIIDTADLDAGLYFAMSAPVYTDGTYTMKIEDGDNSSLTDAADVATTQLVYGTLPALSAITADLDVMPKEGVHSTKRYVRISIVSTSVTTGATINVVAIGGVEVLPSSQT